MNQPATPPAPGTDDPQAINRAIAEPQPTDAPPPQEPDDAEFEEWKDREDSEDDDLVTEMYRAQREADDLRAELAALRIRLETAEAALRAIGRLQTYALSYAQIRSETIAIAELVLNAPSPAPGGGGETVEEGGTGS